MDRKTVLYDNHVALQGKMMSFAGYSLPMQYPQGVLSEHRAVREYAGIFDVSHMGELMLSGPGALPTLQKLLTNDYATLPTGRARYALMLNENGGVKDDLIVYRMAKQEYMIVVNATNRRKDIEWIREHMEPGTELKDASDMLSLIAVQGPLAQQLLAKIAQEDKIPQKRFSFVRGLPVGGQPCLVARTGYTGEDGFELYMKNDYAPAVWEALLEAGEPDGVLPCGLGARDMLRLEAAMPLYGHELTEEISPLEAGLGFAVKMEKDSFIGKEALTPPERSRAGIFVTGRGIARTGCEVYQKGKLSGVITSGGFSPALGVPVSLALVKTGTCLPGSELELDVRGKMITAISVVPPFYQRKET